MTNDVNDIDGRLSAYLDGELPDEEREALEKQIANDERLAARLEALRMADQAFCESAEEIDRVPMSASLDALLGELSQQHDKPRGNVIEFPIWKRAGKFIERHRAAAACAVMISGVMALQTAGPAQVASRDSLPGNGTILAQSDLGSVLSASASGDTVAVGDSLSLTPRFTFVSKDQDYCRVADLDSEAAGTRFVACRSDADWQIVVATFSPKTQGHTDAPYRTASQAGSQSIETFLDETMQDGPLGQDAEQALLESGWSQPVQP